MAEIDNYDKSVDVGLRNLDKLVIDPMLKERLSDAQDLWRKLLPQIESEEDLAEVIGSLDTDCWGPYMGQQALLTGWVEEVDVFSRGSLIRKAHRVAWRIGRSSLWDSRSLLARMTAIA